MEDVYKKSLEVHRQHRGKLEVMSRMPLENRDDLSLAYTPGVAEVSREIGRDPARVYDYTIKSHTVAVVSDGSAILGLGNLGAAAAIPVMEGKAALFKRFGGIDAFPICLDTQGAAEIIAAVKNIAPVFGGINLEDIAAPRCFEVLERLRDDLNIPVMHDDQQGTAVVVLAALINALRVISRSKEEVKIVLNGAGAAGIAVARMLLAYGFSDLTLCDSRGVIHRGRSDLNREKAALLTLTNHTSIEGSLADAVKDADIFIGVSKGGVLSEEVARTMRPGGVVLALANPEPEIMPDLARAAGAAVVGTGRSDWPNQINNVLAFPGIFRGALERRRPKITDQMLLAAAINLAAIVSAPTPEKILPSVFDSGVAEAVSAAM